MESEEYRATATVEEIQKRLHRPKNSQSLHNFIDSSQFQQQYGTIGQNSTHELHKIESRTRLEDFLDPVLLSAVRAEICGKRSLKVFKEEDPKIVHSNEFDKFEQLRMRKIRFRSDEAVDLRNDGDSIGEW